MRARTGLLASLIGIAVLHGHEPRLGADSNVEPRNVTGNELTVIHRCVREVQRSIPGSDFDARVGAQGAMRYEGTDAEIAAFKRCMQTKGYVVE